MFEPPALRAAIFLAALIAAGAGAMFAIAGMPGAAGDTTADVVLGQSDFTDNAVIAVGARGLDDPIAETVDVSGHLYIADAQNDRVLGWRSVAALANGAPADIVIGQPDFASSACETTRAGLCNPAGVAVDGSGNLYVADYGNNRVLEYDSPFSSNFAAAQPAGMVFGQASFTSAICTGGLAQNTTTPTNGATANGLCFPSSVALDSAGDLYVADSLNNRVLEFNTPLMATAVPGSGDATADRVFGQNGSYSANGCDQLCGVSAIALDSADNLYASNFIASSGANGRTNVNVIEYNTPLKTAGSGGPAPGATIPCPAAGSFACLITGLAVDSIGNLYVADGANNRVLEFNTPLTATSEPGSGDTIADVIFGQTPGGDCVGGPGDPASIACGFEIPHGLATDTANGLYVADSANNRVLEFNSPLADPHAPNTTADLVLGQGDFAHNGLNYGAAGAAAFDLNFGEQVTVGFQFGITLGSGVAVDAASHLYLDDLANNRVLGWKSVAALANGASADLVIGQPDFFSNYCQSTQSGLCSSQELGNTIGVGIAVDSAGNLYVTDSGNNRVMEFDSPFSSGFGAGQPAHLILGDSGGTSFSNPTAVAVDSGGNLYVADTANNRVLEFNTPLSATAVAGSGDTIADAVFGQRGDFDATACNQNGAAGPGTLCGPVGVAVDPGGNLYIADTSNNRVLEFDTPLANPASPNVVANRVFGQTGSSIAPNPGCVAERPSSQSLCLPSGVALDAAGDLYVSDTGNSRVLEFTAPLAANGAPGSGDTIADQVFGQDGLFNVGICGNGSLATPDPTRISTDSAIAEVRKDPVTVPAPSAEGLCAPSGLALDTAGNLYVVDSGNNRVLIFDQPPTSGLPVPTPSPTLRPGGALSLSPQGDIDFGGVGVGRSRTVTIVVRNKGRGMLRGHIDTSGLADSLFTASGARNFALRPGQREPIRVRFAPTFSNQTQDLPQFEGAIVIASSDPRQPLTTVRLTGVGLRGSLTVVPNSNLNFGGVAVGKSKTIIIKVVNASSSVVSASVDTSGLGAPFGFSGPDSFTLGVGRSGKLKVKFIPTAAGTFSGELSIVGDDGSAPDEVFLSGTGQ